MKLAKVAATLILLVAVARAVDPPQDQYVNVDGAPRFAERQAASLAHTQELSAEQWQSMTAEEQLEHKRFFGGGLIKKVFKGAKNVVKKVARVVPNPLKMLPKLNIGGLGGLGGLGGFGQDDNENGVFIPFGKHIERDPLKKYYLATGVQECDICRVIIDSAYHYGPSFFDLCGPLAPEMQEMCRAQQRVLQSCPEFTNDWCYQDLGGTQALRSPCPPHLKCHYCLGMNPLHCATMHTN